MEVEVKKKKEKVLTSYLLLEVILSTYNKYSPPTTGCIKPFKVFIKELSISP